MASFPPGMHGHLSPIESGAPQALIELMKVQTHEAV